MPVKPSQSAQSIAFPKTSHSGPDTVAIRAHLSLIVASPAFKGSRRSQEFLQYIVEKALTGQLDALKERVLGVELFGRSTDYDTSEDAIVRVTASDLRRRLQQFYTKADPPPAIRIELRSGSYVPEFRHVDDPPVALELVPPVVEPAPRVPSWQISRVSLLAAIAVLLGVAGFLFSGRLLSPRLTVDTVQPWAALFQPHRETRIIFCDPDISLIQRALNFQISLSDYANRRYRPDGRVISPEVNDLLEAMRGTKVAYADATTALSISELASSAGHRVRTHTARSLQLVDFKTDDSFILLGSPRSNPWFALFQDHLDFHFAYDAASGQEIVVNRKPRQGELTRYLPTAMGGGTGQAYAVLGFLPNPGQKGHVLVLAGSNAEATEAAGRLAVNLEQMARTLREHGIDPTGPEQAFEMLLRVATMAGSPNTFEVVACHKLRR
ncbi:MAG TPA: hypothetical protein VFQ91_18885 [Bryobacteraceae bacterium]|nr:hypothetical protein [Bryobacteraceae bacterium]